ncbi:unnamed protein product [Nesidiocoris tenuis]|uniref:Uncharacterized protein n=1 Tax=Nesidiocoris tenuis TaxID=355587 RepID=A0A6H5HDD6_9HEMI|nr:unnamed protein product [Nesidiocoris tenuis]
MRIQRFKARSDEFPKEQDELLVSRMQLHLSGGLIGFIQGGKWQIDKQTQQKLSGVGWARRIFNNRHHLQLHHHHHRIQLPHRYHCHCPYQLRHHLHPLHHHHSSATAITTTCNSSSSATITTPPSPHTTPLQESVVGPPREDARRNIPLALF